MTPELKPKGKEGAKEQREQQVQRPWDRTKLSMDEGRRAGQEMQSERQEAGFVVT